MLYRRARSAHIIVKRGGARGVLPVQFLGVGVGVLNSFVFLSLHSKASGLTASVPAGRVIETLS